MRRLIYVCVTLALVKTLFNRKIAKDKSGSDKTKKRLSADGQTPKPTTKQLKMAATRSPGQTGRSSKSDSFERDYDKFIEKKITIIADIVEVS